MEAEGYGGHRRDQTLVNIDTKRAGVVTFTFDKIDFKTKSSG